MDLELVPGESNVPADKETIEQHKLLRTSKIAKSMTATLTPRSPRSLAPVYVWFKLDLLKEVLHWMGGRGYHVTYWLALLPGHFTYLGGS